MGTSTESVRVSKRKAIERVALRAYLSSAQNDINGDAWNKLLLNAVSYDLGQNYDLIDKKFTAPVTGLYRIEGSVSLSSVVSAKSYGLAIYKNGVSIKNFYQHSGLVSNISVPIADEIFLRQDDYIELYTYPGVGGGVNTVDVVTGTDATHLIIRLVSKEGIRQ